MTDALGERLHQSRTARRPLSDSPLALAGLYGLVTAAVLLAMFLASATDYVGSDNDDIMRLVEVRDLLAGQAWFDLTQYRLGLESGTPMHWSRLVDLPIALLISGASLFLPQHQAEAVALAAWPLLLIPFLLYPLGLAARRLAGPVAMHVALGLGSLFAVTSIRFHPGAIDHHNVQLVLAAWMTAMLVDPQRRRSSYAIAGVSGALATAIGAETVPFVAAACLVVSLQWIWHGHELAAPTRAFGISLSLTVSAAFFLTVAPSAYSVVTCDSLSLGFYALSATGGVLLALVTGAPGFGSRFLRLALGGGIGVVLLVCARALAPQCLASPLAGLDPMLVKLWLSAVTEAQPFTKILDNEPHTFGGFYAVGFFAMAICLFRSLDEEQREVHLALFLLIGVNWAISLVQVRGFAFANLISILPLALLITDLRQGSQRDSENANAAFAYVVTVLAGVPAVWALVGALIAKGVEEPIGVEAVTQAAGARQEQGECADERDMAELAAFPTGVVAAPSNSGAEILRYTSHRVLTAPYHRNQAGMLTELHIGLAPSEEAEAFLAGAGVTVLAFCKTDPQTQMLVEMKSDGLYAGLARGDVPTFLKPVGGSPEGFRFYEVRRGK
ncbi:hypothetical protein ABID21_000490 [Pseudorhizobium tarimense]|uniref:4-amino-4-deoxy-L-arabinose transferase n=1 Tax=Pseudorhizobium tarimense TaxID=1079109 RepID=A0ABV2H1I3_9HYPH|nr:hypothetical protein [Pseudorhizobium tarimense]MCJ8517979.1 hypothetical protein [Pseudorhizobium tarimense]